MRQILRVLVSQTTPANIRIKRVPVSAAELFRGGRGLRRVRLASRQDDTPVGRGERAPVRFRSIARMFRSHVRIVAIRYGAARASLQPKGRQPRILYDVRGDQMGIRVPGDDLLTWPDFC